MIPRLRVAIEREDVLTLNAFEFVRDVSNGPFEARPEHGRWGSEKLSMTPFQLDATGRRGSCAQADLPFATP